MLIVFTVRVGVQTGWLRHRRKCRHVVERWRRTAHSRHTWHRPADRRERRTKLPTIGDRRPASSADWRPPARLESHLAMPPPSETPYRLLRLHPSRPPCRPHFPRQPAAAAAEANQSTQHWLVSMAKIRMALQKTMTISDGKWFNDYLQPRQSVFAELAPSRIYRTDWKIPPNRTATLFFTVIGAMQWRWRRNRCFRSIVLPCIYELKPKCSFTPDAVRAAMQHRAACRVVLPHTAKRRTATHRIRCERTLIRLVVWRRRMELAA